MQREFLQRCVAVVALLIASCAPRPPAETEIRTTIETMRKAAEAQRADAIADHIAGDFTGRSGELDRAGLERTLKVAFLGRRHVGVSLGSIAVAVNGDRAKATFGMTVSDASNRWLPSGRATYDVVSGWRRERGEWVCYNAAWTERE